MSIFLDRLMLADPGGNDLARSRRSPATGPFQFINATFVSVAWRYFPSDIAQLSRVKILALRTNRKFAWKAAEAYTKENAAHLAAAGHRPTFTNFAFGLLAWPWWCQSFHGRNDRFRFDRARREGYIDRSKINRRYQSPETSEECPTTPEEQGELRTVAYKLQALAGAQAPTPGKIC